MIRRIRRHRLLGESPVAAPPVLTRVSGDVLGALRTYRRAIETDADSYEAWIGLSNLFDALEDAERSRMCRGVARRLRLVGALSGQASRN